MKIQIENETSENFAKRAMWLAWRACGRPVGMGFLQDNPEANEEAVWKNIGGAGDYPGGDIPGVRQPDVACADYVFGRMMKLRLKFHPKNQIELVSTDFQPDYQGFSHDYPTPKGLFDATAESLRCSWSEV